jgi:hypothetical protein
MQSLWTTAVNLVCSESRETPETHRRFRPAAGPRSPRLRPPHPALSLLLALAFAVPIVVTVIAVIAVMVFVALRRE